MKKIILTITALLCAIAGFSQQPLKPVKVDSLVTVSLPAGFQKKDTLTQQIYSVNATYGYMIVIRTANDKNNAPLQKEKDLNNVLKDYMKKIVAQSPGSSAIRVRDTTLETLKAKNFTLKNDNGEGDVQLVNFTLIYTTDATYTFEYVYPGNRETLVKDEYKTFISSIRLSPELQRNDQYLSNAKGMSSMNKIEIFGGAALVIILVIVFVVRRKNKAELS